MTHSTDPHPEHRRQVRRCGRSPGWRWRLAGRLLDLSSARPAGRYSAGRGTYEAGKSRIRNAGAVGPGRGARVGLGGVSGVCGLLVVGEEVVKVSATTMDGFGEAVLVLAWGEVTSITLIRNASGLGGSLGRFRRLRRMRGRGPGHRAVIGEAGLRALPA
jgi:hypothetical protein